MKTGILLFVFGLVLSVNYGFSQFIRAGIFGPGDLYTDVVPDSVMCASEFGPYQNYLMNIDIDRDGLFDLAIHVDGGGSLSGGASSCTVNSLALRTRMVASYDSSYTSWGWWYVPVADTLDAGDSISSANEYIRENCYVWSTTFGGATGPWVSEWEDIGDHYIGVRINSPEIVYGWVRIDVSGTRCVTVKDYAINKRLLSAVSLPVAGETPVIFPNPANSTVRITMNETNREHGRLSVYTHTGGLFYQADCPAGRSTRTLDVSSWPAGLYLIKAETGGRLTTNRLAIHH